MSDELAGSNVNRSYSLAATSIAILTFMLFFLFPRFENGEINALLFQVTLVVMGVAIFALVLASLHYYRVSCGGRLDEIERASCSRRGDRFWLLGTTLLLLDPGLILLLIDLRAVGAIWLGLWLFYLLVAIKYFPSMRPDQGPIA